MIHQPYGGVTGQTSDVQIQAEQIIKAKKTLNEIIAHHTGKPVEQVTKDGERDRFFSADEAWAFDYHDGTWIITPDRTIKLRGHYVHLIADLEQGGVRTLLLSAPRVPNDPLLRYFQDAGYSAPNAVTPQAEAAIPTNDLLTALEKAEALGYTITRTTWRPLPAAD
jgi:hypothetical protein